MMMPRLLCLSARPGPALRRVFARSLSTPADVPKSALVLFSGGQDSTTCLAWALSRFDRVETLAFDYGQRHNVELECRKTVLSELRAQFPHWAPKLGEDHKLDIPVLGQIGDTAMTSDKKIEMTEKGLPNTFVPGRNIVFLTFAAALAYRRDLRTIVGGMCETDFSGYPDCRDDAVKALQVAVNVGMDSRFVFETPLMWIDKAQTWHLTKELGGEGLVELVQEHTHTCYLGDRSERHEWGYGCGTCPSCALRKTGFEHFRQNR